MLLPLRPAEIVEVICRRTGITHRELAARIGWRPGTLDAFLARLRSNKTATRADLDLLSKGLADDRFELFSAETIRNMLHAASGIDLTHDEVEDLVRLYFPGAQASALPHYAYDSRGFVRWTNQATTVLVALLGGPPQDRMEGVIRGWVGGDTPVHLIELAADPTLGIADLLGSVSGRRGAPRAGDPDFDQLVRGIRYLRAAWDDFRAAPWFSPIDRRLSELPVYAAAMSEAMLAGEDTPRGQRPMASSGVFETVAGPVLFSATAPVHDPRLSMECLLPASADLWTTWQRITEVVHPPG